MNPHFPEFSSKLITWYLGNKRELPWRNQRNPYFIWLSEIILQQTRVSQGIPYYLRFVQHFPSVLQLAEAQEQEVLKLWQGLGYYSRARNLLSSAKMIADMNGVFPQTYEGLLKLKGVGDYTAAAIASICYNEKVAVVDGNVYRVLSRVFGIDTPINTGKGKKEFKQLAALLIDPGQPGIYNQAIMEFGATHCTPKLPNCESCMLQTKCHAFAKNQINDLPVKLKSKPAKNRYFNYFLIEGPSGKIAMEKRNGKDIWKNLFQLPLVETPEVITETASNDKFEALKDKLQLQELTLLAREKKVHKLSHQHIHTSWWRATTIHETSNFFGKEDLLTLPVPILIARFLQSLLYQDQEKN